eukprot:343892-Lingulodinium_polyedra.AAC.1
MQDGDGASTHVHWQRWHQRGWANNKRGGRAPREKKGCWEVIDNFTMCPRAHPLDRCASSVNSGARCLNCS